MSKVAAVERAIVKRNDPYRAIVLPLDVFSPLKVEGSPWLRVPLGPDRVILVIHREDLYALAVDAIDREQEGEKVGDVETVMLRRLLFPEEMDAVRQTVKRLRATGARAER